MGDLSHDLPFDTSSTSSTHHLITSSYRDGDPQPCGVIGTVE